MEEREPYHKDFPKTTRPLRSSPLSLGLFVCTLGMSILRFISFSVYALYISEPLKTIKQYGIHIQKRSIRQVEATLRLTGCSLTCARSYSSVSLSVLLSHSKYMPSLPFQHIAIPSSRDSFIGILAMKAVSALSQTDQTNLNSQVRPFLSLCVP